MIEQPNPASGPARADFDLAPLVTRARQADPDAFDALARRYSPVVLAYFYGRLPTPMDADDLLQEVLLTAFRNLSALRDEERFGPWLLRIAESKYVDALRAHRRAGARALDAARGQRLDYQPGPEGTIDHGVRDAVRSAVAQLPVRYRLVVTLRLFEELSLTEIAERLGLKESTARMRYKRGLDMLRKSLRRKGISA